jgi:hypothetical protein
MSNSGDGSIGYGDLKLGGSGNTSHSQCSKSNGVYKLSKAFVASSKTASAAIVSAWQNCISRPGYHASVEYGDNPSTFFVYLGRRDENRNTEKGTALVTAIPPLDCSGLSPTSLARGISWDAKSGERLILCSRADVKQPISIALNFVDGPSQKLSIPATKSVTFKWVPRGPGDCADNDVGGYSPGSDKPVPASCNDEMVVKTAVCWGNIAPSYPHPAGRNFCTYKSTETSKCLGTAGMNGTKYECLAVEE